MMKLRVLSLVIPALMMAGTAGAAEIYNKDGNKLDLYGKIDGLHYFSNDNGSDGDQSYMRFGLRGETQISNELTGYGQWEYQAALNKAESDDANNFTRVGFAGLKFAEFMLYILFRLHKLSDYFKHLNKKENLKQYIASECSFAVLNDLYHRFTLFCI